MTTAMYLKMESNVKREIDVCAILAYFKEKGCDSA